MLPTATATTAALELPATTAGAPTPGTQPVRCLADDPSNPIAPAAYFIAEPDLVIPGVGKYGGRRISPCWVDIAAYVFCQQGVPLRKGHPEGFEASMDDRPWQQNYGCMIWPGALTSLVYIPEFGRPRLIATKHLVDDPGNDEFTIEFVEGLNFRGGNLNRLPESYQAVMKKFFDWEEPIPWEDLPYEEMWAPSGDIYGDDAEWMWPIYIAKQEAWEAEQEQKKWLAEQQKRLEEYDPELADTGRSFEWYALADRVVFAANEKEDQLKAGNLTVYAEGEGDAQDWDDFMSAHELFDDEEACNALALMKLRERQYREYLEKVRKSFSARIEGAVSLGGGLGRSFVVSVNGADRSGNAKSDRPQGFGQVAKAAKSKK